MSGTSILDREVLAGLSRFGVRYVVERSIGYDNIDVAAARQLGLRVCNAVYDTTGVADYTVLLLMMCVRNMGETLRRMQRGDFRIGGLGGRALRELRVGIVGTGRIGAAVARTLHGFGCELMLYDRRPAQQLLKIGTYAELDALYQSCDALCLHMPWTRENTHLICDESIAKMREGMILVNTARGELVDSEALLRGLDSGKIAATGLDVYEGEKQVIRREGGAEIPGTLRRLMEHPHVIVTPHVAFFTEHVERDVIASSMQSLALFERGEHNPLELK